MRASLGIFGLAAGIVVIAPVARHAYGTADTPLDGVISGFYFGVIAIAAIFGPAATTHLWRTSRAGSLILGLVTACALVVNISNSLGALANRGDKLAAGRAQASEARKDDRETQARLVKERAEVGAFTPADADAVEVARKALAAAERTRSAECGMRGARCRDREADERTASAALAKVVSDKTATDKAARLDEALATVRARLAAAPAVGTSNPQAALLARLLRLHDVEDAATAQAAALAVVVELAIIGALLG